jgi:hypothetical protein
MSQKIKVVTEKEMLSMTPAEKARLMIEIAQGKAVYKTK